MKKHIVDIYSLDESKTIPPSGLLCNTCMIMLSLVETYISKAYTGELHKVNMIPIFIQFDNSIDYANSEIEDYTLYRVSSTKANMILNKRYKLLYGSMLKQLNIVGLKIINCKKPSFVADCEYSTILNNLWTTEIVDEVELNTNIKK